MWAGGNPESIEPGYDPNTGVWTTTGSMTSPRAGFTLTLLPSGKVLVAGGYTGYSGTSSAELYDPDTGGWTPTGSMHTPRLGHMAILLTTGPLSGRVLIAGGDSACAGCTLLDSAELYDPSTGMWSVTDSMTIARYWNSPPSARLPDGSVLVVGGTTCCPYHWFNEAESFDPVSQTWTPTSIKTTAANEGTALLPDGQVLVAGGITGTQPSDPSVAAAELFNAQTGT